MNMPSKGSRIIIDGYGSGIFAGMRNPENGEAIVLLKFEGTWRDHDLNEGYGTGIIAVPLDEYQEDRIYPEQCSGIPEPSTEKRDQIFEQRFEGKS